MADRVLRRMLRVTNLRAGYGDLVAVDGVSLHVGSGEIVVLIGANGAGKSTLLTSIMGMTDTMGGEICFNGTKITRWSPERTVRVGISLVPEGRQIFASMTVRDNLVLGFYRLRSGGKKKLEENISRAFELFPILRERQWQAAGTLSGGEQQMLAIGRALMSEPEVLLLDEPSMGLAPKIAREILQVLARLRELDIGILLVEQNSRLALELGDRGYVIETGKIVIEGDQRSLLQNEEVRRAYLGGGFRKVFE